MSEAESWLGAAPKMANGKVDALLLVEESKLRGYCVCPRPMRQIIDFEGLTCRWCGQPDNRQSWQFWYGPGPVQGS